MRREDRERTDETDAGTALRSGSTRQPSLLHRKVVSTVPPRFTPGTSTVPRRWVLLEAVPQEPVQVAARLSQLDGLLKKGLRGYREEFHAVRERVRPEFRVAAPEAPLFARAQSLPGANAVTAEAERHSSKSPLSRSSTWANSWTPT
jgi:hypothetical protein